MNRSEPSSMEGSFYVIKGMDKQSQITGLPRKNYHPPLVFQVDWDKVPVPKKIF